MFNLKQNKKNTGRTRIKIKDFNCTIRNTKNYINYNEKNVFCNILIRKCHQKDQKQVL